MYSTNNKIIVQMRSIKFRKVKTPPSNQATDYITLCNLLPDWMVVFLPF